MHKTTGTLRYSPQRHLLKREDQADTLILDLPKDDLDKYYQWMISRQYGSWLKLQSPMFGCHITVVRPQEVNLNHPKWLAYEGENVEIEYSFLERHWEFWSLNVHSNKLVQIRSELGLRTDFRLHITVGRQFDWQPKVIIKDVIHDTDYI